MDIAALRLVFDTAALRLPGNSSHPVQYRSRFHSSVCRAFFSTIFGHLISFNLLIVNLTNYRSNPRNRVLLPLWFSFGFLIGITIQIGSAQAMREQLSPHQAAVRKFRVNDPELAAEMVRQGARLVADYSSFQVLQDTRGNMPVNAPGLEDVTQQNLITLNASPLDTSRAEVIALRQIIGSFNGKHLYLVHFAGPIKSEWVTELQQSGAELVTYVPHNAYLVYADAASLRQLQIWAANAPHVQWEGNYADDYKIHPRARTVDAKGNPRKPSSDLFAIQLVADDAANAATLAVIDRLKLEPIRKQSRVLNYLNVIVRLPPERLAEIAAQPEVVSIQSYPERKKMDERQDQIMAGNLTGNSPAGPG